MNQRKRWKIAGICLVSWLALIITCGMLLTIGIMTFGLAGCSEEPTTEWISEEALDDLIFIK